MRSEITIKRDMCSATAKDELDELVRQQERDIALEDSRVRMDMRDRMIGHMTRKSPEVQVNVANQIQVEKNITVTQLLERYQQFIAGSDKAGSVCGNGAGQQVHQA